ncbi:MAG: tRNA (N(6)-L-threonylcarbamoyladenosine(37)-C(2))-methylthiotransferase MtaB [Bacteroidia bacterium]|nr:tRNA (N(6)-L-threonylcarbamoyladenosine(37)-C(2))-methylthiotransferase MtaB [Bacteroidia bacterium]
MKIAFYTLGCKLNYAETSTLHRVAVEQGHEVVSFTSSADVYVINTCTVTGAADKKCRNIIRKAIKQQVGSKVIVTGCYAELNSNEISEIEGVSLIIGNSEKSKFVDYLNSITSLEDKVFDYSKPSHEFFAAYSIGDRTRSFLKVQDGCNYFCSYCTIPFARGRSRNAPIADLVKEAEIIASKGIREIVLTGINIGDFGHTTGESFLELIKSLNNVTGIERFRISSIEPDLLSTEIIEFVASSKKFMPHFHIPLQSGSDKILGLMKRKYDTNLFIDKVRTIHRIIPEVCIGIDVIVGFPGETDTDFNDTFEMLKSVDVAHFHVFSYSERENTLSSKMDNKVSDINKEKRSKILHKLSDDKKEIFYKRNIGKEVKVLFESRSKAGYMEGFTENYIKVEALANKELYNNVSNVKLLSYNSEKMIMNCEIIK